MVSTYLPFLPVFLQLIGNLHEGTDLVLITGLSTVLQMVVSTQQVLSKYLLNVGIRERMDNGEISFLGIRICQSIQVWW